MTAETTLLIARHGNTFSEGETLRRVGAGTDIPLVASGRRQAKLLALFLQKENLIPDIVYSSHLKRAVETAEIILDTLEMTETHGIRREDIFNEIDYGPDEGKPEAEVLARLGADALKAWDEDAVVPLGWNVLPDELIQNWLDFGEKITEIFKGQKVLVVTSNGIARFAPYLTGDFEHFKSVHNIKLATGAVSRLTHDGEKWRVGFWNTRPEKILQAA